MSVAGRVASKFWMDVPHFRQAHFKICRHFSAAVATAESRSKFIESLVSLYKSTKVDGLDLDWEYPGQEGDPGNKFSLDDTDNYLIFMKALRKALGPEAKLTAAVTPIPWIGKDGNPSKDLKGFAEVMDWVLIMNYDVNVREYFSLISISDTRLDVFLSRTAISRTKCAACR